MTSSALDAFKKHDFESDQSWQDYLKRVEIPASSAEALLKLKAKWYIRNIDDSLNINEVLGSEARAQNSTYSAQGGTTSEPTSSASTEPSRRQYVSAPTSEPRSHTQSSTREQHLLFCLHVAIIICSVLYLVPIVPMLSMRAYRIILQVNILASFIKIRAAHGMPKFRPLAAIKEWTSQAIPTTDFQYLMLSLVFLSHPSMTLLLVPITTLAVYHAFAYGHQQYSNTALWRKYGNRAFIWLGAKQRTTLMVNAMAEVFLGFLLIFQLMTPARNFLLLYMYWNMLRMRFWAADASIYHRQVWSILDQKTLPYRARLPILQTPIAFVQKWFTSIGR